jgi:tRNA threonylcarbamoyladenosine modification (KEOPS) complex Cgi121 subunit
MIIMGARGHIRDIDEFLKNVAAIEKRHSITIQFFRADRIFGAEHLQSAAEKAVRSIENKTSMSKNLGMEIMLYAAAERQTSEALRKIGIFKGIVKMGVVVIGQVPENIFEVLGLERDDSVLDPEGKDYSIFGISAEELEILGDVSVPELVLEKVALSEVAR